MPCISPINCAPPPHFISGLQPDNEQKVIGHIMSRYGVEHPPTEETEEEMESWLNCTGLIHLTELDLSNLELALALPPIVAKFTNLKKLNLNGNFLRSFPDEFEALTQLEHLSLCGNSLEGVPWQLTKLPQLKFLDISGNSGVMDVENALEIGSLEELVADGAHLSGSYGSKILHKLCHKLTRISVKGDPFVGDQVTNLECLMESSLQGMNYQCEECNPTSLRVDALPPA